MCGIAVIVQNNAPTDVRKNVKLMNNLVRHRGPDACGINNFGRVTFGHTRLSIIDLSDAGAQPMSYGRHHITFNGEIYNYKELRETLIKAGRSFTTQSDTEVLLVALTHWGIECLSRLKGMFAFAYLDEDANSLYLVRDRFGKKPLVYSLNSEGLVAASEVKQILVARQETFGVNLRAASEFVLNANLNFNDETFFDRILEVRGGHYLKYDIENNKVSHLRWFEPNANSLAKISYNDACHSVKSLLLNAVRRRLISDVPLGACLSGGLDSSSIVSLVSGLRLSELQTITIFTSGAGDERAFSRKVADKYRVKSHEIFVDNREIWKPDLLNRICYLHDQPIPSGSMYNQYCLFKAAREQGLTVMLDGQGADEYFGGYGEFWFSAQMELLRKRELGAFLEGIRTQALATGQSTSHTLKMFLSSISKQIYPHRGDMSGISKLPMHKAFHGRSGFKEFRELSIEELMTSSLPFQVHSEDRNSMGWSVESRLPFLDDELVDFVLSIPTSYKCRQGVRKSVLRDAISELPTEVMNRRDKVGFAAPDEETMKSGALEIRKQVIDASSRLSRLFDEKKLLTYFDRVLANAAPYDGIFFRLLSLDSWMLSFGVRI